MTPDQTEQAIRGAGVGWDQQSQGVVLAAAETPGYCNAIYCQSLAAAATRAGSTQQQVGDAVFDLASSHAAAAILAANGDTAGATAARAAGEAALRAMLSS